MTILSRNKHLLFTIEVAVWVGHSILHLVYTATLTLPNLILIIKYLKSRKTPCTDYLSINKFQITKNSLKPMLIYIGNISVDISVNYLKLMNIQTGSRCPDLVLGNGAFILK
jgi:hypothetical protein